MLSTSSVPRSSTKKFILSREQNKLRWKLKGSQILLLSTLASFIFSVPAMAQSSHPKTEKEAVTDAKVSNQQQKTAEVDALISLAKQKNLATHPTWLRLHYYKPDHKLKNNEDVEQADFESKVKNRNFFISEQGKTNPQAELEAFITTMVMQSTNESVNDENLACHFPARTHWVREQIGLHQIEAECPQFDDWIEAIDPQQFSIVFAGEYPDRPVSAFGHTLLLIDSTQSLNDPTAVDKAHSLNDTVGGNPDDPFVVYALKAAFGGYPNDITIEPYTKTLHEYLQRDNRDVWTYTLDLTKAEIDQIMRHVWETKDLKLPYYFTLDNCASEILRHIDVIRPEGNLLEQFKLAVVPKDIIQLLDKEGFITKQTYTPADRTLAQAKRNNPEFSNLPDTSLNDNNKLNLTPVIAADNSALDAHARQRVMLGAGAQDDTSYLSLAYRGGFNGPLDKPSGYPQNFHLEAGSVELRVYKDEDEPEGYHDRIELEELAVLRGRSFNPLNTARDGNSLLSSWGINVGAYRVKDGSQMALRDDKAQGSSHIIGNVAFEKGLSAAFGSPTPGTGELPPHLCYAFGTGMAQVGKGLSKGYRVGAGVNLGCRYHLASNARLIGEVQLPYWYHGSSSVDTVKSSYWQPILSLGAQYDFDRNNALRLRGKLELQDDIKGGDHIQLAYVRYF